MDVLIAGGGAEWEEAAVREVEASSQLRLARRCVDAADLLALAHTGRAAAAIVSLDLPGLDLDAVSRLEAAGVVVATVDPAPGRSEALGVRRVLQLGRLDDLVRESAAPPDPVAPHRRAPLVAVWGPAGAPGRSTVALSLAAATAARGVSTTLVDADTSGGSLGQMLAVLDDVSGLVAACRAVNNGRPHEVRDHVLQIDTTLSLLTGLPRADMWPQVRPRAFEGVLDELRGAVGLVVADIGSSIEPASGAGPFRDQTAVQVLELADLVVVVGRPDPVGLSRLVRALHDLSALVPGVAPVVVINQMRASLGWRERDVRATVLRLAGVEPLVHVPFDQTGLDQAAMGGRTPREAAPTSPVVARAEVLASHVLGAVVSPDTLAGSGV